MYLVTEFYMYSNKVYKIMWTQYATSSHTAVAYTGI